MALKIPPKKEEIGLDDVDLVGVAALGVGLVVVVEVDLLTLGVAFCVVFTAFPVGCAAACATAASGVGRGLVVVVVVTLLRTASPPREARAYSYLYCPRHPIVDRNQLRRREDRAKSPSYDPSSRAASYS
jgi:hypothetical protein